MCVGFYSRCYCLINVNATLILAEKFIIGYIISANAKHKRAYAGDSLNSRTNLSLRQLKHACLPFSNERKNDRHARHLPHSICCSVFPRCALKGRKWMWYLCTSQSYSVLWWFRSPHTVTPSLCPAAATPPPLPDLKKRGKSLKLFSQLESAFVHRMFKVWHCH